MIINIFGKVQNGYIEFEPPPVFFGNDNFVHINEVFIEWKTNVKNINGHVTSSMVDLCPVNPKQQMIFFYQNHESNYLFYSPTRPQKYKIQCQSIQSSVFQIELSRKEEIERIYIQLQISNEGYQCLYKK